MMKTYKLYRSLDGQIRNVLRDGKDSIPFDPANTDAVEFAKWLQEGNRPEPAEEDGVVTDEWVAETIAKLLP
jgi:hypothetical protein